MLTDILIARFRGGGRPARNWGNGHLARCRGLLERIHRLDAAIDLPVVQVF